VTSPEMRQARRMEKVLELLEGLKRFLSDLKDCLFIFALIKGKYSTMISLKTVFASEESHVCDS
jgi:hypothetical protein